MLLSPSVRRLHATGSRHTPLTRSAFSPRWATFAVALIFHANLLNLVSLKGLGISRHIVVVAERCCSWLRNRRRSPHSRFQFSRPAPFVTFRRAFRRALPSFADRSPHRSGPSVVRPFTCLPSSRKECRMNVLQWLKITSKTPIRKRKMLVVEMLEDRIQPSGLIQSLDGTGNNLLH